MKLTLSLFMTFVFVFGLKASDTYELAIEAMVYNKDIKNAYKLSQKLLEKHPKNVNYLEWAAKLALWNGSAKEALEYYYRLYKRTAKERFAKEALKLSMGLKEYDVSLDILQTLLKDGGDRESLKLMVDLLEYRGRIDKAIEILKRYRHLYDKKSYYERVLELYMLSHDTKALEKVAAEYLKTYGTLPTKCALYLSKYYLTKGETKNSYEILLRADEKSDYYLQRVVEFATYMEDKDVLKSALEELFSRGIESEWYYASLTKIYLDSRDFKKALKLAKKGLVKYGSSIMFYLYTLALNHMEDMSGEKEFLQSLNSDRISKSPYYWTTLAKIYASANEIKKAQNAYVEGIKRGGYRKELVENYLWFLIDNRDIVTLKRASEDPNIIGKVGERLLLAVYIATKEDEKALRVLRSMVDKEPNDYNLLLLYSDMLYTVGKFQESEKRRFEAYLIMRDIYLKNRDSIRKREFLQDYLRLSLYYEPYYKIQELLEYAKRRFGYALFVSTYLNFSLMNGNYDTAQFYLNRLKVVK